MIRRWQILLVAGLIGVASLLLVPFETLISQPMPPLALRGLAALQPAIMTALAVMLGQATAGKVGLRAPLIDAWISGGAALNVFRRQVGPAIAVAFAVSGIILIYTVTVGRDLLAGPGAQAQLASFNLPLASKLLYGGISEELITRWGLVSLFVWVGWRLVGRPDHVPTPILAAAVAVAALLFAAAHLPLLHLIAPDASPGTVMAVLAGNAVPGVLFGWLYVRKGLESAILAHMASHLLSTIALTAI